jgi:citrate synthase
MPKQVPWTSEITKVAKNSLITRGIDQKEIISSFSYEQMVFLLLTGKRPTPIEADLLRAVILAHCSHGITGQSTLAVRMAADSRAPFLNSALAGFLVGSGDFHQGALTKAMQMLEEASEAESLDIYLTNRVKARKPLFGYGHRFHSKDPRAIALMQLCDSHGFKGKWICLARRVEAIVGTNYGRFMNIESAGGAILLDLGLSAEIAPLIILVGRAPMFAATYLERIKSTSKPFQRLAIYDIVPEARGKKYEKHP